MVKYCTHYRQSLVNSRKKVEIILNLTFSKPQLLSVFHVDNFFNKVYESLLATYHFLYIATMF